MKILFLAPQPFFQERGTPIAVRLAVAVLAKRADTQVHLLTYHEGQNIKLTNVEIKRMWAPRWLRNIGPGISFKKILCDFFFAFTMVRLLWQARGESYDLIHAVEESVFLAWIARLLLGIPYVYDMDSSLALQVTEKWAVLKPLLPVLQIFEKIAVKNSVAVVPVCDSLAEIAVNHGSRDTHILRDVSMINPDETDIESDHDIRKELDLKPHDLVILYIGNLESYQGIDLLVESFERAAPECSHAHLVIVGGVPEHIQKYQKKIASFVSAPRTHFLGPRPVSLLSQYLAQADILASPRTRGNNTPMKIYSYLHSGKVTLATRLPTHTQVLSDEVSRLAAPEVNEFSAAMLELLHDGELRASLGQAACQLAEQNYTYEVFSRRLNELYDRLGRKISPGAAPSSAMP